MTPQAGRPRALARRVDAAATLADADAVDVWRRLAVRRENPFLTPDWYEAWIESHPAEDPFLIAWGGDGPPLGFLPLVRVRKGPFKLLQFAGGKRGDWFTPACAPEEEAAMMTACAELLRRERREWHLLFLERLDSGGVSGAARPGWLDQLAPTGRPATPRSTEVLPFIAFDEGGYEEYLASRSRNFRSQLGRRRRKLEGEHALEFKLTTDAATLSGDLETFFSLHEERWSARGGSSALSADAKDHHRRFARAALEQGWLRLWTAEADGRPAAAWYGWRIGGRYCYSLSGLSDEFESLGLGTVLLGRTIEHAAAEGCSIYDLMWGDDGYKARFETGRREAGSWVIGRPRHPARGLLAMADELRLRGRGLPPWLADPARRILRSLGS